MLVHHADALANGVARPANSGYLAVDQYFATIGRHQTIQNVHQCRFARAILADQSVDLAFTHRQIDMIAGDHARPGFIDIAHLYRVRL